MNEKDINVEINSDINNTENMQEALVEMKEQKRKETIALSVLFIAVIASMAIGYNAWQKKSDTQAAAQAFYNGGTPAAYNLQTGAAGGGCSSSSAGGSCCSSGTEGVAPDLNQIEALARKFYVQNFGDDKELNFKVQDFGCHIQIDVYSKDGKLAKTLVYRDGQISEY